MHIKGLKGQAAALLSLHPVVDVARLLSIISPDVCAPSAARLEIARLVFLSVQETLCCAVAIGKMSSRRTRKLRNPDNPLSKC